MSTPPRRWPFLVTLAVALLLAACSSTAGAPSPPAVPGTGLAITAIAGPVCPVEQVPPDPACAPRPVVGATVLVLDGQGTTVATLVTDAAGTALIDLPAGDYVVQGQPVNGLMGTAAPVNVIVVEGTTTPVALAYDTGIR